MSSHGKPDRDIAPVVRCIIRGPAVRDGPFWQYPVAARLYHLKISVKLFPEDIGALSGISWLGQAVAEILPRTVVTSMGEDGSNGGAVRTSEGRPPGGGSKDAARPGLL